MRIGNITAIASKQVPPIKAKAFIMFLKSILIRVAENTISVVIIKCSHNFVFLLTSIKMNIYSLHGN